MKQQGTEASTKTLGQALRNRRKSLKITQADLAGLIGVNAATIGAMENGKENLRIGIMISAAQALGCDLELRERREWTTEPGS